MQTVWTQIRPDKTSDLIWIHLFDTLIVFLKEFFLKSWSKKISRRQKSEKNFPGGQRVNYPNEKACLICEMHLDQKKLSHNIQASFFFFLGGGGTKSNSANPDHQTLEYQNGNIMCVPHFCTLGWHQQFY